MYKLIFFINEKTFVDMYMYIKFNISFPQNYCAQKNLNKDNKWIFADLFCIPYSHLVI